MGKDRLLRARVKNNGMTCDCGLTLEDVLNHGGASLNWQRVCIIC